MMSSHRSIGLGVVGSGRMGTHRARLAAAHPGVEYLRVMDISLEAAERSGQDHRGGRLWRRSRSRYR